MEKKLTRAEEAALKRFPNFSAENMDDVMFARYHFRQGYEQAEKDLKEWVEEQLAILDKQTLLHPDDDVFWAHRNLFKEMKDKINSL